MDTPTCFSVVFSPESRGNVGFSISGTPIARAISEMNKQINTAATANSQGDRDLILIVDDELDVRNMIIKCLEREGIATVTAASVEEAIAVIRSNKVALTLLDWGLDGPMDSSGSQVLRVCRELCPLMPVIVMSGLGLDVRTDAVIEQADGFLAKPFSNSVIRSHVNWWLKRLKATPKVFLPQRREDILPLGKFKRIYIRHVVQLLDDNVSLAAEKLGIHRQTVSDALKNDAFPDSDSPSINPSAEGRSTSKLKSS
jgi:DNA-binding response OmpR family regulator